MQKATKIKESNSNNSSPENTTQESPTETIVKPSKKTIPNEGSPFTQFFRKIACSSHNFIDDESEVLTVSKADFK